MSATITQEMAEKHVRSCVENGMSEEQIRMFTSYGYIPHPVQQRFHAYAGGEKAGRTMILIGESRAGGKSHACVAQAGPCAVLRKKSLCGELHGERVPCRAES